MDRFTGIVHDAGSPNGVPVRLPLEEVDARIILLDVSARVTLSQTYINSSDHMTSRAKYVFPVPASAAVCAFEMHTDGGRNIIGRAKDSSKAKKEYENAVQEGKQAGLLELLADDIFTISVGCIPAKSRVETKLVFVMTLLNSDDTDEVRFQLPRDVGERYGSPHPELATALQATDSTRVRITVDIQTSGRLRSVKSPSHAIIQKPYETHLGRDSRRRMKVKFRSHEFLERDFVLIVQADGLDAPRCFAELEHDPEGNNQATLALQLVIMPKFNLPPTPSQEYLFVVDRSGSMSGARIETAKQSLSMLLRILPVQGTTFNIISFGSHVDSLWTRSVAYTQASLNSATDHLEGMGANYGGTEIRAALHFALRSRDLNVPTAAFILTDGESHDYDGTISEVQAAVAAASVDARLRVFVLGIGESVSSAMVEGIARAGNGDCLFAVTAESIIGKCGRLLYAGKTPVVENVTIDWGIPASNLVTTTVKFSPLQTLPTDAVHLRPPPAIQQSPPHISNINAGMRFNVSAILTLRNAIAPKEVTLRGSLDGEQPFELVIPIRGVQLKDVEPGVPLVHTLAAWRLIQDLEENRTTPPPNIGVILADDVRRKAAIIRLAERYQLASLHTSFVAVESVTDTNRTGNHWQQGISSNQINQNRYTSDTTQSSEQSGWRGLGNFLAALFLNEVSNVPQTSNLPGAWPDSPAPSSYGPDDDLEGDSDSAETFSTISSLEGSSTESEWTPPPTPHRQLSEEDKRSQRSPSPSIRIAPQRLHQDNIPAFVPPPVDSDVVELVKLQSFDGSFSLGEPLNMLVGRDVILEADALHVDRVLWATALAAAFMMKRRADSHQKELLDHLVLKAVEFLKASSNGSDFDVLILRAQELM